MLTLIAYASKYGAAETCAKYIAEKLDGNYELVNLKKTPAPDLAKYDKIILGGSIYASNVQKEVKNFCTTNLEQLRKKPLGLFLSCMGLDQVMLENNFRFSFPAELMEHSTVADALGGAFDFQKMNFMEKQLIKIIDKRLKKQGKPDLSLNGKQNISTISTDRIDVFAEYMNHAK